MEGLNLDLGMLPEVPLATGAAAKNYYKGKEEYAGPFFTVNIADVEHLPDFEVVSVNGEALQLQRGVDVPNIPIAYINVLKQAIASRQVKLVRADQTEYYEWRPYPAIPFQLVEGPYKERKLQE